MYNICHNNKFDERVFGRQMRCAAIDLDIIDFVHSEFQPLIKTNGWIERSSSSLVCYSHSIWSRHRHRYGTLRWKNEMTLMKPHIIHFVSRVRRLFCLLIYTKNSTCQMVIATVIICSMAMSRDNKQQFLRIRFFFFLSLFLSTENRSSRHICATIGL